jgi:predicted DNA-binding transcriptional regulator YafY
MGRDITRLKRLIDLIDRHDGASINELQESYGGMNGGMADRSTIERVLKYMRETLNLTISTRGYRYFLDRNEGFQLFNAAASTSAVADLLTVEPGKDVIIDLGAFKIGSDILCMNEVVEGLKTHRELRIYYKKLIGGPREWRTIRPMFLRWYASHWYLFARDIKYELSEAPRAFRLDGIEEVEFGQSFKPRKEDSPTFFAQKFIGVSGNDSNAVEVTLHMDNHAAKWLESTIHFLDDRFPPSHPRHNRFKFSKTTLTRPKEWWEVKITIDPNAEFMELLMRIQAEYKVIGPESFKTSFKERLGVLLKRIS